MDWGWGMVQVVMLSDGERWGEVLLTRPPLTSCCAAHFLTGRGPVSVRGLGVGDPWYRGLNIILQWWLFGHLAAGVARSASVRESLCFWSCAESPFLPFLHVLCKNGGCQWQEGWCQLTESFFSILLFKASSLAAAVLWETLCDAKIFILHDHSH